MANELSRISERLIRARERTGHGAARVWVPPPARREPTRRELPADREPPQKPRQDAPSAQSQKAPSTWVAIHVQLRHEPAPAENVFEAHSDRDEEDDEEIYVEATAVERDEPLPPSRALPAPPPGEAFFVPRVFASESTASGKQTRGTGILHYLATRALSAYLSHSSFASVGSGESRLLDVHA